MPFAANRKRPIQVKFFVDERELADNVYERSELDYLIYNVPLEYADLRIGAVSESADCRISGSGDLSIGTVNNLKTVASGSADIDVAAATGVMDITVSGAGDIHAGGTLELLKLQISGAGDFKGKELTVDEAELTARGAAAIHIGRIKKRSSENLSANSTLVVDRRG